MAELERLMNEHFEKHQEVYGEQFTKPKWHSMLHLGDQIRRDLGILFDTIANERENKVPKKFGESILQMKHFCRTVFCLGVICFRNVFWGGIDFITFCIGKLNFMVVN